MEPDSRLDLIIEDLPGIGRRYEMTGTNGGRIIVIITHSGRRVVHGLDPGADQASAVELTDRQARKLGAILGGAFFKPAVVEVARTRRWSERTLSRGRGLSADTQRQQMLRLELRCRVAPAQETAILAST